MIRVAVVDESEVFRRGVAACLDDMPSFEVASVSSDARTGDGRGPIGDDVDVAVVSGRVARQSRLPCALVVCASSPVAIADDGQVRAVLPRSGLTAEQLVAAVQGAAAGLRVSRCEPSLPRLDERRLRILQLLAEGATTREISESLRYSQRTIKGLVASIQFELRSSTRAQAVATAIRSELI